MRSGLSKKNPHARQKNIGVDIAPFKAAGNIFWIRHEGEGGQGQYGGTTRIPVG